LLWQQNKNNPNDERTMEKDKKHEKEREVGCRGYGRFHEIRSP
jgi:hypothetical protein